MSEGSDKRKFKRISTNMIVRIRTQKPSETTFIRLDQRVKNASVGGLFIETLQPFLVGSVVEFDFRVPGSPDLVRAKGLVRWSNDGSETTMPAGMGVEFLEVSKLRPEAINALEKMKDADEQPGAGSS